MTPMTYVMGYDMSSLCDFMDELKLVPVYKRRVWFRKFEFEACEVLNNNKFTFVNVCFQYKHNEEYGLYGQTLKIKFESH